MRFGTIIVAAVTCGITVAPALAQPTGAVDAYQGRFDGARGVFTTHLEAITVDNPVHERAIVVARLNEHRARGGNATMEGEAAGNMSMARAGGSIGD